MGGDEQPTPPSAGAVATLVGRRRELAELGRLLDAVTAGHGRLCLLEGEPGIGKTHLAAALGEHARTRGFAVHWGRCWEDGGAPAFWPWTQVLRALVGHRDDAAVPPLPARLAAIMPEIAAETANGDPDQFVVFDAVASTLRRVAEQQPLLLLFDDIHAADVDSLRLLQFVARGVPDSRIAIVATYRAEDARRSGTATLLARLGHDARVVPLRGLSETEVGAFVAQIAGEPAQAGVVRTVHSATEGNPLFVDAITHVLVAEQRLHTVGDRASIPLPPSVRDAIGMRLGYLDDPTRELLRVAAVIGRSFDLGLLGAVVDRQPEALIAAVDGAAALGVVSPTAEAAGGFVFDHILVRDTLYGELDRRTRVDLHWRVGVALEQQYAGDPGAHATELAHHFLLAAGASPEAARRAVDHAEVAGRWAMSQSAYDEAAVLFEQALRALQSTGDRDPRRHADLLLALGAARTRGGDTLAGRSVYLEAAAIARQRNLPERLAAAAIGYAGMTGYHFSGRRDDTLVSLLEEALGELPPGDSETRVRLLARLAVGVYWSDLDGRRFELSEEAVAMARRLRDPSTLAMAIHSRRYAQWGPDNFEQRLADATQCLQLALEANDLELAVSARRWRFTDLLEDADVTTAARELDAHDSLAQRLRQPFLLALTAQFRALWAIMHGHFADGEPLAGEARTLAERAGNPRAEAVHGQQLFPVWWLQDNRGELERFLDSSLRTAPPHPARTSAMALIHAECGDVETATALVEQLAAPGLTKFRHDMLFLPGIAHLALVCDVLGARQHAEHVYDLLRPYAGRIVTIGAPAQSCWGPVDHYLGVAAALHGMSELAVAHFEAAIELGKRLGAAPWLAATRAEYGRLLAAEGESARADALLGTARRTAETLGLQRVLARIAADVGEPGAAAVGVDALAGGVPYSLRQDGEYWTLTTPRGGTLLRDVKGLQHLAVLLDHPRRRQHVLELSSGGAAGGAAAIRPGTAGELDEAGFSYSVGFGDAGALLDDEAKAAYRSRLDDLDDSIDEAERFNDPERVARLGVERDRLIEELARSVGLGGRDRRAASAAERARVNVTRALRSAIRRISEVDPAAGRYLDATVVTGTYCTFDPDRTT